MILEKEQIYRYMRHIAISEISGIGQKKILESSTVLYSENTENASLALYYLVASGVGHAYCHFSYPLGWKALSDKLKDLNNDSKPQLHTAGETDNSELKALSRIIIGDPQYVKKTLQDISEACCQNEYIPAIVSIYNGWKGIVQTLMSADELAGFIAEITKYEASLSNAEDTFCPNNVSIAFGNLMAVLEHLKLALSNGKPLSPALCYDLLAMDFDFISNYTDVFSEGLSRQKPIKPSNALAKSKVLIAGCGGLGSPAAFTLAASGIGQLGLVDYDKVEISNLNRQIMHTTSRIGMAKVLSGKKFIESINPDVKVVTYDTRINKSNVMDLISSYDVIISGLDNLPARYILNDACYAAGKPLLEAGALDISGLATTIIPGQGHCYRCIFPESSENSLLPSCEDTGVLGPIPGIMGVIQAAEAIKLLTGIGESLKNRIFLFDAFDTDIYVVAHGKNSNCELCS